MGIDQNSISNPPANLVYTARYHFRSLITGRRAFSDEMNPDKPKTPLDAKKPNAVVRGRKKKGMVTGSPAMITFSD